MSIWMSQSQAIIFVPGRVLFLWRNTAKLTSSKIWLIVEYCSLFASYTQQATIMQFIQVSVISHTYRVNDAAE